MLKRVFAKVRPSPAMVVALLGVALGLGSNGWAANGGAFVLGVFNSATLRTALVANINDSALQVSNTSAGASAVPLLLTAAAGHPPMKVNTAVKVTNLNADYLDGLNSTALTRVVNVPYNLAPGARSAAINVPFNRPGQLVGIDLTHGDQGAAQVSLLLTPAGLFQWVGLNSYNSGAPTITASAGGGAGQTIVFIDFAQSVSIESASIGTIKIHNANTTAQSGSVSLMW